ncbi:two-component system, OmpR family, response regulator [Streptomyces zhaozhouensis]|uniref:Two-component system, OmpR family, response regulator n=1 Tax=Streptomyces zhaozhouensis TaxID=1300267 RepID=A0A286E757_9ACTN|nr:response regulator transcription factor [Streptomyces zhaozhouensis]SOD66723.1 two-component system, OmpR family, response regulator [Streptomyces zhaozhouensis]
MQPRVVAEGAAGGVARVLIVEDEPNILELLTASLELSGFATRGAPDARGAVGAVGTFVPDIAVVDVTLPDRSGLELVADLRGVRPGLPVLFLTARDTVDDRLAGFRAGADDYVTKPFSLEEVVFRLRAILRRAGGPGEPGEGDGAGEPLRYADLELDEDAHAVRRGGRPVRLSPTEFSLLRYLLLNSGRVVSKSQILERVWGGGTCDTRVVETYVSYLRRKVHAASPGPALIQTVRGVGYSLRLAEEERR